MRQTGFLMAGAVALALSAQHGHAGGIFEVIHPDVVDGGFEMELLNTIVLDDVAAGEERSIHELAIGFGIAEFWKPVLAFELANVRDGGAVVEAIEVANVFILYDGHGGDHGGGHSQDHGHGHGDEGGFTFGLYAAAELPTESDADPSVSFGPIGEVALGPVEILGNLFLEVPTSSEAPGLSYAFAVSTEVVDHLALGVEFYGAFDQLFGDNTPDVGDTEHFAGPALYTEFETSEGLTIEPRLALLFGLTSASTDMSLSANIELKF